MKFKDLAEKTESELQKTLSQQRGYLQQLRFDLSAGKVKNVREIRKTRKNIAQLLTILHKQRQS